MSDNQQPRECEAFALLKATLIAKGIPLYAEHGPATRNVGPAPIVFAYRRSLFFAQDIHGKMVVDRLTDVELEWTRCENIFQVLEGAEPVESLAHLGGDSHG